MNRLKVIVSLITKDNDYQREQAAAAEQEAKQHGVDIEVMYADSDAINQSQDLLKIVQSSNRPDAIICEPVGTGLKHVANAAAKAGIAWALVNNDAEYIPELRRSMTVPVFGLSVNHKEVGRLQGQQIEALLPNGGLVLYIAGPATAMACQQRTAGIGETLPKNVQLRSMHGRWTEESGFELLRTWLTLSTSRQTDLGLVVSQNDSMAIGARKAFQKFGHDADREKWMKLGFLGCDGCRDSGQAWVSGGQLQATVVTPPVTNVALEMLVRALRTGVKPPERTSISPYSYPSLEELKSRGRMFAHARP